MTSSEIRLMGVFIGRTMHNLILSMDLHHL
jgi:hypothetical protein